MSGTEIRAETLACSERPLKHIMVSNLDARGTVVLPVLQHDVVVCPVRKVHHCPVLIRSGQNTW